MNLDPLVVAIDLGTSGPKVGVFDRTGLCLASAFQSVSTIFCEEGIEQDPEIWWRAIDQCVVDVLAHASVSRRAVVAVSATAQWSGTVVLDKQGKPLMNALIWMDTRGAQAIQSICGGLLSVQGYSPIKLINWLIKTGGAPSLAGKDSIAHIAYIKSELKNIYEQVRIFLEPKDYINYLLTGVIATSYDSMALHWMTDNRRLAHVSYDRSLLNYLKIDPNLLPPMQASTSILAPLSHKLCQRWGLPSTCSVITGSPDVQTAAVGSGAVADFAAHLYIGTSSWISCHVPFKRTSIRNKIATLPSALPGKYFVANEQESAGLCLDRLKNSWIGDWRPQASPLTYEDLEELASGCAPGAGGVIFTPWLNGERTPVEDKNLRGGFHNISLQTDQSALVRSVFEGVAYNTCWLLDGVEDFLGRPLDYLHFIGGGAHSALWCQIHADVLNREIRQVEQPQLSNLRGAAWLAFMALGEMVVDEIAPAVRIKKIYKPISSHRPTYIRAYQEFLAIYRGEKKRRGLLHR